MTTSESADTSSTQKQETTTSNFIDDEDVNVETTQLPVSSTTSLAPATDVDEISTVMSVDQTTQKPATEVTSEQAQVTTTSNILEAVEEIQTTTQTDSEIHESESNYDEVSESTVSTTVETIDDEDDTDDKTTQKSEPEEESDATEQDTEEESATTQSSDASSTEKIDDNNVETTIKPLVHHTSTQTMLEMEDTEPSSTVQPSETETSTESESIFTTIINTIMTTIAPDMFASTEGTIDEQTHSTNDTTSTEMSSEQPVTTVASDVSEHETISEEVAGTVTETEVATDVPSVIVEVQTTEQATTMKEQVATEIVTEVSSEITTGPPQITTNGALTTESESETEVVSASDEATTQTSAATESQPTTASDTTTQGMSFCIESGMVIQSGKVVPNADPCKRCICDNGEVLCSTRECPPKPKGDCSPLPIEAGQCCPKYACIDGQEILDDDSEDTSLENNVRIRPDEVLTDQNKTIEATETVTAPTYPPTFEETYNVTDDKVQQTTLSPSTDSSSTTTLSTTTTTLSSTTSFLPTSTSTITSSTETSSIDSLDVEDTSIYGTASSDFSDEETTTSSIDEYIPDYPFYPDDGQLTLDDLDKIGPGACLFDGKVYVSAQQIPRENPCDFCFCFRGDIICLQQSCPPPIPGCREEIIGGFCCPRYECPVKMATHNITVPAPTTLPSLSSFLFGGSNDQDPPPEIQQQISGCEVNGNFYETGAIVEESSSPCLQCR